VSNGTDKPPRHPATCNWSRTPILGQSFCYLFPMLMTEEIVEAFLNARPSSPVLQRAVGVQSEFSEWQRNRRHDSTDWFQRQQRVLCRCELDPVEGRRTIYPHKLADASVSTEVSDFAGLGLGLFLRSRSRILRCVEVKSPMESGFLAFVSSRSSRRRVCFAGLLTLATIYSSEFSQKRSTIRCVGSSKIILPLAQPAPSPAAA